MADNSLSVEHKDDKSGFVGFAAVDGDANPEPEFERDPIDKRGVEMDAGSHFGFVIQARAVCEADFAIREPRASAPRLRAPIEITQVGITAQARDEV